MANLQGFDARQVEPSVGFDPIPAGKYPARIIASEMKETRNQDGHYLELTFEVLEGPYRGRKLWDLLNLDNPSEKAVQIARANLSAICRAVGVMTPRDSVELHNLPMVITVKLKKRNDTGELQNEVSSYAKPESEAAASEAPAEAAEAETTAPWLRP
jgi:hypothetical protein